MQNVATIGTVTPRHIGSNVGRVFEAHCSTTALASAREAERVAIAEARRDFFDSRQNRDLDRMMRCNRNRSFS